MRQVPGLPKDAEAMTTITPTEIACNALREELRSSLEKCSKPQQDLFARIFPGGIESQPEEKLKSALDLVQRTIAKNEKDPSRLAV